MLTCLYSSQILKARSMRNHWEVHLFWRGLYFYIQATIKYIPSSSYVSIHTYIPLPLYYILRLQSMRLTALLPIGQHQFSFNGLPFTSILLYTYASRYWKSDFIKILDPIFRQDRYFIIIIVLYNCDVIFRTTIQIIYYIVLFSGKSIGNDVMVFKLNILLIT